MLIKERMDAILKEADTIQVNHLNSIHEADFNDSKNRVRVTVLKEGTSHNNVHYTTKSLEQVKGFLETTAKKVYINHPKNGKVLSSRDVGDWIGNVDSTFIEGGALKADVTLFKDGPHAYIYSRMKENVGDFGPSIIGKAVLKKTKIDGKKVQLAEDIVWLKSFDIVDSPSAGGSVDAILESIVFGKDEDLYGDSDDNEGSIVEGLALKVQSLKDKQVERKIEDALWPLKWAFNDSITEIVLAQEEYETVPIADRKTALDDLFKEAVTMFKALSFAKPRQKSKDTKEEIITESINKEDLSVDIKDLAQLKVAFPEFTKELVAEGIKVYKEEQKIEETVSENKELTSTNGDLKKELDTIKESNTSLEKENKEFKAESEKVVEQKLANRKVELVNQVKKDVDFPDEASSDLFETEVASIELGDDEEAFVESITAKFKDRKELFGKKVVKKKVIEGAGHSNPKGSEEKADESKLDSEFAEAFNVKIKS